MRKSSVFVLCAVLSLVNAILPARAQDKMQDKINVVASFSILGDFVRNVGGERVAVTTLVGPNGDAHVYTPTPQDAKKIAEAKLLVVNGLGFEGWLPRLVKSSGGKAMIVTATQGITPRDAAANEPGHDDKHGHAHGHDDPHAWQSVANAKIYVGNIRDALTKADPAGAEAYKANADAYLAKLTVLDSDVKAAIATIPEARRKVISTHDAFGYFAAAYGIAFIAPQGVSTDSEPSAKDIAVIITQLKLSKIPAVFLENIADPRLMRRIAAETGAKIGGTLFSDSLTAENGDAPTYIDMVRHNIKALTSALTS
jgi:zinc/manganese transport system substrate-binding protein